MSCTPKPTKGLKRKRRHPHPRTWPKIKPDPTSTTQPPPSTRASFRPLSMNAKRTLPPRHHTPATACPSSPLRPIPPIRPRHLGHGQRPTRFPHGHPVCPTHSYATLHIQRRTLYITDFPPSLQSLRLYLNRMHTRQRLGTRFGHQCLHRPGILRRCILLNSYQPPVLGTVLPIVKMRI